MATQNVRYDWYQTEADVVLAVMKRNVALEKCKADFGDGNSVSVNVQGDDGQWSCVLALQLAEKIDPNKCSVQCRPSKIEIKMRKLDGGRWQTLTSGADGHKQESAAAANADGTKTYPSSSGRGPRDWDKLAKEAKEEEEKEQKEGDAAVNSLFQKIYADADDDVKKAMIKSYTESHGTVLSTNWTEVGQQTVECKPPDSMEYKPY